MAASHLNFFKFILRFYFWDELASMWFTQTFDTNFPMETFPYKSELLRYVWHTKKTNDHFEIPSLDVIRWRTGTTSIDSPVKEPSSRLFAITYGSFPRLAALITFRTLIRFSYDSNYIPNVAQHIDSFKSAQSTVFIATCVTTCVAGRATMELLVVTSHNSLVVTAFSGFQSMSAARLKCHMTGESLITGH